MLKNIRELKSSSYNKKILRSSNGRSFSNLKKLIGFYSIYFTYLGVISYLVILEQLINARTPSEEKWMDDK